MNENGALPLLPPCLHPGAAIEQLSQMALTLTQLEARYVADLREEVDFWLEHGVDHEHGGFICGLKHDGTRLTTNKFVWFQGRGLWVFSYLYQKSDQLGLGSDDDKLRWLDVARKTCAFVQNHGRDEQGQWTVEMTQTGGIVQPAEPNSISTSGYGSMFAAEGLLEYTFAEQAASAGRQPSANASPLTEALKILKVFVEKMDDDSRDGGEGYLPSPYPGVRTAGAATK